MNEKKINVCFAASAGGHLEQLMMLKKVMNEYNSFILTEKLKYDIVDNEMDIQYVNHINRKEFGWVLKFIKVFFQSIIIFAKKKPDCIICTGVLAMIPMCIICKIFGCHVVYIESFAKSNSPTETGKLLYKFADNFYVQWESMKKFYPKAKCLNGIY